MVQLKEQQNESQFSGEELAGSVHPGALLKQARLDRKLTAEQVSDSLRISERYITAIEEQDSTILPEQVYTLGFVRTYSLFLGLDAAVIVDKFRQSMDLTSSTILDFPIPEKASSAPKSSMILISLGVAALVYALWTGFNQYNEAEPVVFEERRVVEQPIKTPVIDHVPVKQPVPEQLPLQDKPVSLGEFFVAAGQQLTITATELSWVEVKDKNGNTLLNQNLEPGQTKSVVVKDGVTISTFPKSRRTLSPAASAVLFLKDQYSSADDVQGLKGDE